MEESELRVLTVLLDVPYPAETGLHLRQLAVLRLVRDLGCHSHSLVFTTPERPVVAPQLHELCDQVHDGGPRVEYLSLSTGRRAKFRAQMVLPALLGRPSAMYPYSIPYDMAGASRKVLQSARDVEADAVVLPTILLHLAPSLSAAGFLVIGDAPDIVSHLTRRVLSATRAAPWRLPGLLVNHLATRSQEALFLAACTEVWTSTAAESEEIRRLVPGSTALVAGNALDEESVFPSMPPREGPIGFIGNFHLSVNYEAARFLIEQVWPRVVRQRPRERLVLAGSGIPPEKVRRLQHIRGVEVLGRVDDAAAFVRSCRAMALPVRIRAGVPMKLIEALACGRPIVATPEIVAGLSLRDGDEVLVADAAGDFANGLLRILEDEHLAARLAAGGRRRFERDFSFAASLDRLRQGSVLAVGA